MLKKRNWNLSNFSCSFFTCDVSKSTNPHVKHDCGSKFVHVNSTLTTIIKLQTLSLEKTMFDCHQNELNVVEKNTCNCSYLRWKLTSWKMDEKVSWITQLVLHLLYKCITSGGHPIKSMGWICVLNKSCNGRWGSLGQI
jgi:hypothetical protein